MLTLLLGTDWVANRDMILNMIANDVAQKQGGRILMVPELISHDTERRLCDVAGDTSSRFAEVLSFTRLARRIADSVGHAAEECMDNGGRIVAMASATRQLHSVLKAYAAVETQPEFLAGLVDVVDEFKRCCISVDDLRTASKKTEGSLAQKLEELSLILDAYDSLCLHGKRDPRDQMTWVLDQLTDSTFGEEHVFYIDGFPDFTRQHLAILEYLILVSPKVVISFNCDRPDSRAMAFEKAGLTAFTLLQCASHMGIETKIQYVEPRVSSLDAVRKYLFQGQIERNLRADKLIVYRTETMNQECIAAAERIIQLTRNGVRYRDIGVVCADISVYQNTAGMILRRYGIPIYLSGTEDILEKSVITAVLTALDVALHDFEQRDVFRYLKSILSSVDIDTCDAIENYAILWNITGSRWLTQWTSHPRGIGENFTDADNALLEELNLARKLTIEPLRRLRDKFTAAVSLKQQIHALYAFFEEISLSESLRVLAETFESQGDNRNAQILNQLWEILLNALEQLYDILGDTSWDSETFTRLVKLLLSQYDVGTIPPVLDSVMIGPVSAMRCQQFKHLIVLGVSEGSFPGYSGSTGILSDQERIALRELGIPLTGGALEGLQAEFSEIYGVFCSADETIAVSCPNGQPSFLYRRLVNIAGGETEQSFVLGMALSDQEETCAYLVRNDAEYTANMLGLSTVYKDLCMKRDHTLGAISEQNVKALYGDCLHLSASQVDRLAECRLSYFLKYGLRVKERKTAAIDPAEFGTYVHTVLENTVRRIMELGGFRAVSEDEALALSDHYSKEYVGKRFSQLDTERMSYLLQRNRQELRMIVRELWQELFKSDFAPVDFELEFGNHGKMPAIQLEGNQLFAQLSGFVDRVDAWENNGKIYYRVVDYKTGKKDFDYCDIYNGLGLQMLLYLFALENGGIDSLGSSPVPAGVQYFPARAPLVTADGFLSDEEAATLREKMWKRKGLLLLNEEVLYAMEPENDPIRLNFTRKKDGTISGDLANTEQLQMLKAYIFRLLGHMVDEIASGQVAPNPYTRGSNHNACTFCPYSSICHPQAVNGRRNYKAISAQRFWEDIKKELSKNGR